MEFTEITKKVFNHLIDYESNKRTLYPTTLHIEIKDEDTLKLSFSFLGKSYLKSFFSFAVKEEIYFYVEPDDNHSISLVIKSSRWNDMTEEEISCHFEKEREISLKEDEDTLKLSFSFLGKSFLKSFLDFAVKEGIYFYVEPDDNHSISLVIKSSRWNDMTEEKISYHFEKLKEKLIELKIPEEQIQDGLDGLKEIVDSISHWNTMNSEK